MCNADQHKVRNLLIREDLGVLFFWGVPLSYDFVDNRVVLQWEKLDTPIDVQNSTE